MTMSGEMSSNAFSRSMKTAAALGLLSFSASVRSRRSLVMASLVPTPLLNPVDETSGLLVWALILLAMIDSIVLAITDGGWGG